MMEGELEFSLGCLKYAIRKQHRDKLEFPLILQVLGCVGCRIREARKSSEAHVVSVSDGLYKRTDCFLIHSQQSIELFSIIKVINIDFNLAVERGRLNTEIIGDILEYEVLVPGSSIGYYSGKPESLDYKTGLRISEGSKLSNKLWNQVKEGKCCDVSFRFVNLPGVPIVYAQKNALIAHSDVFEAQFSGEFTENSGVVQISDTEPKYLKSLIQYIYTQFVPILNITQAFEILYLANKYMITDLVSFCREFIINNQAKSDPPRDIFELMDLNTKCCDDAISNLMWQEFARYANVFIRKPKFLEQSLETVETIFTLPELNANEWELLQALKRWAAHKNVNVNCTPDHDQCLHQLLECIRWKSLPLKEAIIVNCWDEFQFYKDRDFLPNISELQNEQENYSMRDVIPRHFDTTYSRNRRQVKGGENIGYSVYTVLFLKRLKYLPEVFSREMDCLHGSPMYASSSVVGPPFQVEKCKMFPCYSLETVDASSSGFDVELTIELYLDLVQAPEELQYNGRRSYYGFTTICTVKMFSFTTDFPGIEEQFHLEFSSRSRLQMCRMTLRFKDEELRKCFYNCEGHDESVDLQMHFGQDLASKSEKMKTIKSADVRRPRHETSTRDDQNTESGVGRLLRRLRSPEYVEVDDPAEEDLQSESYQGSRHGSSDEREMEYSPAPSDYSDDDYRQHNESPRRNEVDDDGYYDVNNWEGSPEPRRERDDRRGRSRDRSRSRDSDRSRSRSRSRSPSAEFSSAEESYDERVERRSESRSWSRSRSRSGSRRRSWRYRSRSRSRGRHRSRPRARSRDR